jgi:proteasome assembly chaperone (PAC2) family protein
MVDDALGISRGMIGMESPIRFSQKPQLKSPCLIAAWSGMGGVALIATKTLQQKLQAEECGEILPYDFFSPDEVLIEDHVIQSPKFPESKFYFWDKGDKHDLLIFIGTDQPQRGWDFAHRVLDVAQQFRVSRIYTSAAFPLWMHHSQEPHVWGTATTAQLVKYLKAYGVMPMGEGTIGGLNGLLLAVARQRGIEGVCLLGEMPIYATRIANPRASQAVLEVLTKMLGIVIDLQDLVAMTEQMEPNMEQLYRFLSQEAKDAIARFEELKANLGSPLEADQELFDEIERFLREQRDKGQEL